ncbi:SdpI family protein [Formosa algae]|uniref:SdpI family protein n=1 Tax=Formosa algae TaxID=225843 RepID=UPI000CCEF0BB|nr:SdpI family protein [Formosa algae]PNW28686.1 hypothetical protein BKP44_07130 [Formosa algae]
MQITELIPTENLLFTHTISAGLLLLLVGLILYKFPPKKINIIYGYKTVRSMKSKARWDFAQIYSAKQLIKWGAVLACLSFVGLIYHPNKNTAQLVSAALILAVVILAIYNVERALERKFNSQ